MNEIRVLRLQKGHKYCLLGQLSSEVGWNYGGIIKVNFYFFLECFALNLINNFVVLKFSIGFLFIGAGG